MEATRRILCLDDQLMVRILYQRGLSRIAEVALANNGDEGLAVLEQNPTGYGVIFTDNEMSPGMGGLDFLRASKSYNIPKIMIATPPGGMPDRDLHTAARAEGALGLIPKPYDPNFLRIVATELLQHGTSPTYDAYAQEHFVP